MFLATLCLVAVGAGAAPKAKIPPPDYPEWKDWSLLTSRPPAVARMDAHSLPATPPDLQPSYEWDNFKEQVYNTEKNLAYGSVLNSHRRYSFSGRGKDTSASYNGIVSALDYGLKAVIPAVASSVEASRGWPGVSRETLIDSLRITDYELKDALVAPLRFTHDGHVHTEVRIAGPGGPTPVKHRPTFGIRFFLKVNVWLALGDGAPVPTAHTLIIFYDMARMFIVNTHTFHVGDAPDVRRTVEASIDDTGFITSRNTAVDGDLVTMGVYNVWNSNPPNWLFRGLDRYCACDLCSVGFIESLSL